MMTLIFSLGCEINQNTDETLNSISSELGKAENELLDETENQTFRQQINKTFNAVLKETSAGKTTLSSINYQKLIPEENLIMGFTIKDDVFIGFADLEHIIIDDILFIDHFSNQFNQLYPAQEINSSIIREQLPKLQFGFPQIAFTDYNKWKGLQFSIISRSFEPTSSFMNEISTEEALHHIGEQLMNLLNKISNPDTYYLYKNNHIQSEEDVTIAIIAMNSRNNTAIGGIVSISSLETRIASFETIENSHGYQIIASENGMEYIKDKDGLNYLPYLDIPTCDDPLVPVCYGEVMNNNIAFLQSLADKECVNFNFGFTCCNEQTGGNQSILMYFEYNKIKCKQNAPYLQVLSMYTPTP